MNAFAELSHKFGSQSKELKIGQSFFTDDPDTVFHTIRYDFVPASIDPNKTSAIDFGDNGKVTITMPNVEGSGTTESVYQGQRKPHQKECVLIINNETGDMILERLNQSMIVKKARLKQEDLTGISLALNSNNNNNNNNNSSSNSIINKSTSILNPMINGNSNSLHINGNNLENKKSSHNKNGLGQQQLQPNINLSTGTTNKKYSLLNGNNTRPNGMPLSSNNNKLSTTISPPSMPVFNTLSATTNSSSCLSNKNSDNNNNNSSSNNNSDWPLKIPDPPPPQMNEIKNKTSSAAVLKNNHRKAMTNNKNLDRQANCLSELSSSSSSDSDDDDDNDSSSSDIDIKKKQGSGNHMQSSGPSIPSLAASLTAALGGPPPPPPTSATSNSEHIKSKKSSGLTLSEDSDSDDDDDDDDDDDSINNGGKTNSNDNLKNGDIGSSTLPSMPKFSQLSQDLQLSESDSDD